MNHYEEILKIINANDGTSDIIKSHEMLMLKHFISILGEEKFNIKFDNNFYSNEDFDDGFYYFHKSMRQIDFYNNHYSKVKHNDKIVENDIGGHLDMLFWNFIMVSDVTYTTLKKYHNIIEINKVNNLCNKNIN
jgi:hypothetical protein